MMNDLVTPPDRYTLFVQTGCSSCIRTKEYLTATIGDFRVVDVAASREGLHELQRLGVRHVPVVALGNSYVMAQDIDDVAAFIGRPVPGNVHLDPDTLMRKWLEVLESARWFSTVFKDHMLDEVPAPNRPGTVRDLVLHIFQIPKAFLDAVHGLEPDWITSSMKRAPPQMSAAELVNFGRVQRGRLRSWWIDKKAIAEDERVLTLQGQQSLHWFLERSTWHCAQHTRQIEDILLKSNAPVHGVLKPSVLDGLPLPSRLWG